MIIFAGHIAKIETLKDRSIKVTIETMELGPEKSGLLLTSQNMSGFFAFKGEDYTQDQLNQFDALEHSIEIPKNKTPSKRLRSVLFRLWESESEGYDDFNLYYIYKIEKIITHYKSLINQ